MKVLFLGELDRPLVRSALAHARLVFDDVEAANGSLEDDVEWWEGDYLLSFLCHRVLPEYVLRRASRGAINFHPASPSYPGIGCVNFALYEGAREYGMTAHHMAAKVDSGPIIATRLFPVYERDTVASLLARTHVHLLSLFHDVVDRIAAGTPLPATSDRWGKLRTRKDLDRLAVIDASAEPAEVARRVLATSYGEWQPSVSISGFTFRLETEG